MNPGILVLALLFLIVVFLVGTLITKAIKYGGLKAAMLGAPIERTIGEAVGSVPIFGNIAVKVHTLGSDSPDRRIGLEFAAKSLAGYQMFLVTLPASEAKKLATLLTSAVEDPEGT